MIKKYAFIWLPWGKNEKNPLNVPTLKYSYYIGSVQWVFKYIISLQLDYRWHIMFWGMDNIELILCIFHVIIFLPFFLLR